LLGCSPRSFLLFLLYYVPAVFTFLSIYCCCVPAGRSSLLAPDGYCLLERLLFCCCCPRTMFTLNLPFPPCVLFAMLSFLSLKVCC
jgi:hypothetical protein